MRRQSWWDQILEFLENRYENFMKFSHHLCVACQADQEAFVQSW